jgi:3-carboxy-cis,cis-muconate cycloisomerase
MTQPHADPVPAAAGGLFDGAYGTPEVNAATGDAAWLRAMLEVERALALGGAKVHLIPAGPAATIADACRPDAFDRAAIDALAASATAAGTPVIALVERLRELVPADARPFVHLAATSQDVLDTGMMLLTRDALAPALADAQAVADLLAGLAGRFRDTPQVGRSLLQHGEVTTFGAACAARLVAVDEAAAGLARIRRDRLALQLGGAVGSLVPAGEHGPALVAAVAAELGLAEPVTPWHTTRGRVGELAAGIAVLAGELAAVAQDVVLLSSTEIGELAVAAPGGSSAMAHKQNPSRAVLAVACAHRVPGLAATVLAGMPQELQRSPGRWQAEWGTLTSLLRLLAGTARHTRATLDGLRVREDRMAGHVRDLLAATGRDPKGAAATGSAPAFVDRALAAHHRITLADHPAGGEPAGPEPEDDR